MDFRVDRGAFSIVSLGEQQDDEKEYWRGKSPHERLEAVEINRRIVYGYDPASSRLRRVLEVVERT